MRRISARISRRSLASRFRQRLVHQHQRRLDDDGARDGDALLLAAGQLAGQFVDLILQAHEVDSASSTRAFDLRLRRAAHLEAEADILAHAHMRKQRVVLEHHAEAALFRAQLVDARARRARCRRPTAVSRPAMQLSVVDLPQPEGPSRAMNSPLLDGQRDALQRVELPKLRLIASRRSSRKSRRRWTFPVISFERKAPAAKRAGWR